MPKTSAWSSTTEQDTDVSMALYYSRAMDSIIALDGSTSKGHPCSFRWQCKPLTSTEPPFAAGPTDFTMALGKNTDQGHLDGFQAFLKY